MPKNQKVVRKEKSKNENLERLERRWKFERAFLISALIAIFILFILAVYFSSYKFQVSKQPVSDESEIQISKEVSLSENAVTMKVPAVNNNGEGVIVLMSAEAIPGHGRVLVDIDSLLFFVDTQNSMRTARNVAQQVTQVDLSNYDLIYTINANASVIGGPSAGAALTIATLAAITNTTLREDIMITGSIKQDGSVGEVGGIVQKAEAAKAYGATLFLVPFGQSTEITYKTSRECESIGSAEFCTIEQVPENVSVSEQVGIDVREVSNIEEAFELFVG
ncbi:MAG: S16 family serine protease [Nanoarchaeota archaeon]